MLSDPDGCGDHGASCFVLHVQFFLPFLLSSFLSLFISLPPSPLSLRLPDFPFFPQAGSGWNLSHDFS